MEQTSDGSLSNSSGMLFVKQSHGICASQHWRFTCALRTVTIQGWADDANLLPHPVTSAVLREEGGAVSNCQCRQSWTGSAETENEHLVLFIAEDNGMPDSEMRKMHWRGGAHWANNHSFPAVSLDCCDDSSSPGWFETERLMAE